MNIKLNVLAITVAAAFLGGCNQKVEVAATDCEQMGKTNDPKLEAELKEKCGRGGPAFKPSSGKTW
jgi:entry exclusion lipoprotein TrbK